MSSKSHPAPKSSGLGGVLKSITKSLKPASGRVPVTVNAKVVGGHGDMPHLLQQLSSGLPQQRAAVIEKVVRSLETTSISSVPEIWYLARDLCDRGNPSSTRRAAIRLMIQCIIHDEDAVGNTLMYFKEILTYCQVSLAHLDPDFDLFFEALRQLTSDGRHIHDLNMYNQDRNWSDFVLQCFKTAIKALLHAGVNEDAKKSAKCIVELCKYLRNCFKFNFALFDEGFTASILQTVSLTIDLLSNVVVMKSFSQLVDTITIFGFIPSEVFAPTIRDLCVFSTFSSELSDICWGTLSHLFQETPAACIDAVHDVLRAPELREFKEDAFESTMMKQSGESRAILCALGALSMLEKMLSGFGSISHVHQLDFRYDSIYQSFALCLQLEIPLLNSGILRILDHLFMSSDLEEDTRAAERFQALFPFSVWYATTTSVFQILAKLKLNTPQDCSYWAAICESLYERWKAGELMAPEDKLVEVLLLNPQNIDDKLVNFILEYYDTHNLCVVFHTRWRESRLTLINAFYKAGPNKTLSPAVRINCLKTIRESFVKSRAVCDSNDVESLLLIHILQSSWAEEDASILNYLLHEFLHDFMLHAPHVNFVELLETFRPFFLLRPKLENKRSSATLGSSSSIIPSNKLTSLKTTLQGSSQNLLPKFLIELSKLLAKLFVTVSAIDGSKGERTFNFLIDMLKYSLLCANHHMLLVILRPLFRIRSTQSSQIFFSEPSEMNGLASTLKRNTLEKSFEDSSTFLWHYPENVDYLPQNCFDTPCDLLFVLNAATVSNKGSFLDILKWTDIIVKILKDFHHFEVYSYVLAHLCSQLSNKWLFEHLGDILLILNLVCDQLILQFPKLLTFPVPHNDLQKSDLQVAYIRTLSSLIGYHEMYTKADEDLIVSSVLFALGSWQKTAIPSIHLLTLLCYETPESLKKYLSPIFAKLQQATTNVYAKAPTLEFFMALIHVPTLTSGFTLEEYKCVFAICFRYIETVLDQARRNKADGNVQSHMLQSHGVDAEVDFHASTQATEVSPILFEYLLHVSYLVIARWFLKISLPERSRVSSFIMRNIISSSGSMKGGALTDMTLACLDIVARFTYCNVPLKIVTKPPSPTTSSLTTMNRWILGQAIVEITTEKASGDSSVVIRRPTGLLWYNVRMDPIMIPANMDTSGPHVLGSHLLLQLFKPLDETSMTKPITLLDDAYTERALNTFDRIPVVANYKTGIVYVGPGQRIEAEILANRAGSENYHWFLDNLADLIKLKEAESIYVGGLDIVDNADGEFAYFWSDEITHLIFHTTTLMPNSPGDKLMSLKKRHIGNNYVNVFFDESGLPFNFNVIKSQFNFLNIVISPHTVCKGTKSYEGLDFYKIKTYRRSGVPGIFSTTHFKLISLEQLPHMIRNIVLMSNQFADIWHKLVNSKYTTNWQLRVRHLKTLREKTLESRKQIRQETSSANVGVASHSAMQSFLEQLQIEDGMAVGDTLEQSLPIEDDLYQLLEFNSFTE